MPLTLQNPLRLYQAALVFAAAILGLVAGMAPAMAIAAALGVVFMAAVLTSLTAGVCLFTGIAFMEAIPAVGGFSAAKFVGLLLVLSWIASMAVRTDRRQQLHEAHPLMVAALVVLASWTVASALWAAESGTAIASAQRWALNLLL